MSIEHVPGATPDPQEELLAQLRELLPGAFPDGDLDVGGLLSSLGIAEDGKPSFSFTWPGIEQARAEARAATTATLVPDPEASVNWDSARDVLIEGDNLQVLKLLKSGYSGQAKLIYIDPPYNTGETFTYNDDFSVPESEYLTTTGQVDEQGNATTSKIENAGRKHAPWLTMMFPRLAVARHLLRRDGVILLSIDDNEVHHLRLMLDAVFGATNFAGSFVWNGGRKNDARRISAGHDYILAYARDLRFLKDQGIRWRERKSGLEEIYARLKELRAELGKDFPAMHDALLKWFNDLPEGHPAKAHEHFNYVDERGVYFPDNLRSPNPRPNLVYLYKGYEPHPNGWAYSLERMEKLDVENRIYYPARMDQRLKIKSYLHEHEEWAPGSVFYKDRRAASNALATLMAADVFDYPKDVDVLARLVHAITSKGDLIVDFFAGSGSTGHAAWKQNRADGEFRRWLLVQAPEAPERTEDSGRAAIDAGYKTIFEISAERLRRAAVALQEETLDAAELGFRIFRARPTNLIIDPPIIVTEGMTGDEYVQTALTHVQGEPVVAGAVPLVVAWEVALKSTGTQLDARVTEHDLDGVTVFEFTPADNLAGTGGRLLVSLEEFDLETADALKLSDDDTLILRGDRVSDATTLTLAPRLQSKLMLLERVPREVSL
jgi:adenine-specific DNA-methyltransferase